MILFHDHFPKLPSVHSVSFSAFNLDVLEFHGSIMYYMPPMCILVHPEAKLRKPGPYMVYVPVE